MLRSRDYCANGDLDSAMADVGKCIQLRERFPILCPSCYIWRAVLFLKRHDDTNALHDLSKAIECDPEFGGVKAYYGRAAIYRRLGRRAEAEKDFTIAKRLDPSWQRPYDEPDEGFVFADLSSSPQNSVSGNQADSTVAPAKAAREIPVHDAAASPAPQIPPRVRALQDKAVQSLHHDQVDAALNALKEAMELTPDKHGPLMGNLCVGRAVCYRRTGNVDAALADCNAAIQFRCTMMDMAYFNRACCMAEKGKYEAAIADFSQSIEFNGKDAKAYQYRGLVYGKQGLRDAADRDFAKAKELDHEVGKKSHLHLP